jgi:hypothetical protein
VFLRPSNPRPCFVTSTSRNQTVLALVLVHLRIAGESGEPKDSCLGLPQLGQGAELVHRGNGSSLTLILSSSPTPALDISRYTSLSHAPSRQPVLQVGEKLADPAYAGWFLRFDPTKSTYVSPPCTEGVCSTLYHSQDQTPSHLTGRKECVDPCDCGGVPCGEVGRSVGHLHECICYISHDGAVLGSLAPIRAGAALNVAR